MSNFIKEARKETRDLLESKIKPDVLDKLIKEYNISNVEDRENMTYKKLLTIFLLNNAREGDENAAELVKRFKLDE